MITIGITIKSIGNGAAIGWEPDVQSIATATKLEREVCLELTDVVHNFLKERVNKSSKGGAILEGSAGAAVADLLYGARPQASAN